MAKRPDRIRWGIQMRSAQEVWRGALGYPWIGGWTLPKGIDHWPLSYETRHEAREQARQMTQKYAYLGPHHSWKFRAVRLAITVEI